MPLERKGSGYIVHGTKDKKPMTKKKAMKQLAAIKIHQKTHLQDFLEDVLNEDKPIGEKNKEIWQYLLRKYSEKDTKNLYLTFVSEDKVGINPKTLHNTPTGVYSYPLDYILKLIKTGEKIPFRGNKSPKKIKILQATSDKVLSNDLSEKDYEKCIEKLKKMNEPKEKEFINGWDKFIKNAERTSRIQTPFGKLWGVTLELSESISNWSKIILSLGFDYVVDNGQGVIHENEPTQALFINPSSYKVIDEEYVDTEKRFYDKTKIYSLEQFLEDIGGCYDSSSIYKNVMKVKDFLDKNKSNIESLLLSSKRIPYDLYDGTPDDSKFYILQKFNKIYEPLVIDKPTFFMNKLDDVNMFLEFYSNVFEKNWGLIPKILDNISDKMFKNNIDELSGGIKNYIKNKGYENLMKIIDEDVEELFRNRFKKEIEEWDNKK